MNSKMLFGLVLGAMVICPGLNASASVGETIKNGVKTGLKHVGKGSVDVAAETLLLVAATHGVKQVADGVAEGVPAVFKILKSAGCSLIGKVDELEEGVYRKALWGTVRGLYGAAVACVSLYMAVETVPAIDSGLASAMGLKK